MDDDEFESLDFLDPLLEKFTRRLPPAPRKPSERVVFKRAFDDYQKRREETPLRRPRSSDL